MNIAHCHIAVKLPFAVIAATAVGALFARLNAPLPWMIGPLLTLAIANGLNAGIRIPMPLRNGGQWLIGTALGLYFTMPVLEQVGRVVPWILIALAGTGAITLVCTYLLMRIGRVDAATAFFASNPGGATEMSVLAERHQARIDQVVAAQTIRVLLVVILVPFAFQFGQLHGGDPYLPGISVVNGMKLPILLAAAAAAGAVLAWRRIPNAWSIGPLLLSAGLTAAGIELSAMPVWLVDAGQIAVGCALGARFSPRFLREAPRFVLGAVISGLTMLIGSVLLGLGVSVLSPIPWTTAILATAPGGLSEMSLTAKTLQLGVPLVVAFQVVRMVCVVIGAAPGWQRLHRFHDRKLSQT
ncbi:MAG: AbrB family transcriptional regulator [Xanthomonadaceae bacterium]|jgi:membrane AbrB-like protein|nr:AbrB family transcriptional regulator [Xanthomonadaceae bacterium]